MLNGHIFNRTKILIGEAGIKKLANAKVVVVGVGGVGGATLEMLARSGVGSLKFIDFDVIDETNINRQLIALTDNIGKSKVSEWEQRIKRINPSAKLEAVCEKLDCENVQNLIGDADYVVDAIDMVTSKICLIKYCKEHNIKIISAMGSGNRLYALNFEVKDIYKTSGDGLAKVLRKKLKEAGIKSHKVVCASSVALSTSEMFFEDERKIGSISYFPVMCGCVLSQEVIKEILM